MDDKRLLVWAGIAEVQVLLHFFCVCVKLLLAFLMNQFTATSFEFNNEPNFQHKLICDFL